MSYFVVQVHSGKELEAKEALLEMFSKKGIEGLKQIHALETYTEVMEGNEGKKPSAEEVRALLAVKRMRQQLADLRFANMNIDHELEVDMKRDYQETIRNLRKLMVKESMNLKYIKGILTGYVIVQFDDHRETITARQYHQIKAVRYIIDIPSRLHVHHSEVEDLYNRLGTHNLPKTVQKPKRETEGIKNKPDKKQIVLSDVCSKAEINERNKEDVIIFSDGSICGIDPQVAEELNSGVDTTPIKQFMNLLK